MAPIKMHVGRIPEHSDKVRVTSEIQQMFERFGRVTECTVFDTFGFVHMAEESEGLEAIQHLNDVQYRGNSLHIQLSKKTYMSVKATTGSAIKLHVGNILPHAEKEAVTQELRKLFEQYGEVVECTVFGTFGFVHMADEQDGRAAMMALHETMFRDGNITVKLSKTVDKRLVHGDRRNVSAIKIHVANIPLHDDRSEITHELKDLFEEFGEVTECSVFDQFAFVHMASMRSGMQAIRTLDGINMRGKSLKVELSKNRRGAPESQRDSNGRGGFSSRGRGGGRMAHDPYSTAAYDELEEDYYGGGGYDAGYGYGAGRPRRSAAPAARVATVGEVYYDAEGYPVVAAGKMMRVEGAGRRPGPYSMGAPAVRAPRYRVAGRGARVAAVPRYAADPYAAEEEGYGEEMEEEDPYALSRRLPARIPRPDRSDPYYGATQRSSAGYGRPSAYAGKEEEDMYDPDVYSGAKSGRAAASAAGGFYHV